MECVLEFTVGSHTVPQHGPRKDARRFRTGFLGGFSLRRRLNAKAVNQMLSCPLRRLAIEETTSPTIGTYKHNTLECLDV